MSAGSGAGWSERGRLSTEGENASNSSSFSFTQEENKRYQELTVLGTGGMGEVSVALDGRLGREVALKRVTAAIDDRESRMWLQREASITARLEHPNIVPVHDAGVDEEGRFFYTMRIIRGQSLEQTLIDDVESNQHLSLVRHFLDACHALAYAHSLGIVHRDIKPANIIVGQLGETQVVDWGLAAECDEVTGTTSVGTPGFMSPEQAQGALPSPSADVWSLGIVLEKIIDATNPDADLEAIAEKALQDSPSARYHNASLLADDVRRYLEGHRVGAREYSSWELLRRLASAWRIPLAIAGLAIFVVAGVVAISMIQIRAESARALQAESLATDALAQTQQSLASALNSQAVNAQSTGALAEAELLAVQSLQLGESPGARGVLARAYAGDRPTLIEHISLPPCPTFRQSNGELLVCGNGDSLSLWQLRPLRKRWSIKRAGRSAQIATGTVVLSTVEGQIILLNLQTGALITKFSPLGNLHPIEVSPNGNVIGTTNGATLDILDSTQAKLQMKIEPCPQRGIETIAMGDRQFVVVCSDGLLKVYDNISNQPIARVHLPFGTQYRRAAAATMSVDGRIAVGGIGGQILIVDYNRNEASTVIAVVQGAVKQLRFIGQRLLVITEHGGASIWDVDSSTELMRLPANGSLAVATGSEQLTMIGDDLHSWRLPETLRPLRFQSPEGLAGAALSPDGTYVAAAAGDGYVRVWRRENGRLLASVALTKQVVKSVSFSPDGTLLAAGTADPSRGSAIFSVSDWKRVSHAPPPRAVKRIAYQDNGTLVAALYGFGMARWESVEQLDVLEMDLVRDLSVTGDRVVALMNSGEIVEYFGSSKPKRVMVDRNARAITGLPDNQGMVVAHASEVRIIGSGTVRVLPGASGQYLDVAVSPDARYVVAASVIGSVDVWDLKSGDLVAILRGHSERVSHLSFDPKGVLATASWDGSIRLWNLSPLSMPVETLFEQARATWGQVDLGRREMDPINWTVR